MLADTVFKLIFFSAYSFHDYFLKTCIYSASTKNLQGMLLGRFLVGTGMGLGPPTASLYLTEVRKIAILSPSILLQSPLTLLYRFLFIYLLFPSSSVVSNVVFSPAALFLTSRFHHLIYGVHMEALFKLRHAWDSLEPISLEFQ